MSVGAVSQAVSNWERERERKRSIGLFSNVSEISEAFSPCYSDHLWLNSYGRIILWTFENLRRPPVGERLKWQVVRILLIWRQKAEIPFWRLKWKGAMTVCRFFLPRIAACALTSFYSTQQLGWICYFVGWIQSVRVAARAYVLRIFMREMCLPSRGAWVGVIHMQACTAKERRKALYCFSPPCSRILKVQVVRD